MTAGAITICRSVWDSVVADRKFELRRARQLTGFTGLLVAFAGASVQAQNITQDVNAIAQTVPGSSPVGLARPSTDLTADTSTPPVLHSNSVHPDRGNGQLQTILVPKTLAKTRGEIEFKQPLDPVAAKAFGVFDVHCARCHQTGKLKPGTRPAADFGNILHLKQTARNPNLVRPGNPDGSALFTSMIKRDMPYDVLHDFAKGARPSAEEVLAVREWINALTPKAGQRPEDEPGLADTKSALRSCNNREFIDDDTVESKIAAHVLAAREDTRRDLRFITLTNLHNSCAGKRELAVYRQAIAKLLNSLSLGPRAVPFMTIDAAGTIITFRLSDIGWTQTHWRKILARYPFGVEPQKQQEQKLADIGISKILSVRGDWLAYAATRAPLYADLLSQPRSAKELQRSLKLSVEANIRSLLANRIAITGSRTARHNRLIERHDTQHGAYWTSYDFESSKGYENLARHPLGPLGETAFRHRLNAIIYTLPNGFPAFFLNDRKGQRLDTAPVAILHDPASADKAVSNASSCLSCHANGQRRIEKGAAVIDLNDSALSDAVRSASKGLYKSKQQMNEMLAADRKSMRRALADAGVEVDLRPGGVEIITALARKYSNRLWLGAAAAELGVRPDRLIKKLQSKEGRLYELGRQLAQGSLSRQKFNRHFLQLKLVIDPKTTIESKTAANLDSDELADKDKSFSLTLYSDKSVYQRNDAVQVFATSTRDCNLTLINVDVFGRGTVIFPSDFHPKNTIKAGQTLALPGEGAPYQFKLRKVGPERIIGVCNVGPKAAEGIEHNFEKQKFTNLGDYVKFIAGALSNEQTAYASKQKKTRRGRQRRRRKSVEATRVTNKKPLVQARDAIIFEVR